jgi:YVTN family beta-propeller protein
MAPALAAQAELLVLNKTDATLSFVDPSSAEVLAVIGTGVGPHEIAVSPDGRRALVANYGTTLPGRSLSLVDLEKRLPLDTIDLGENRRPHGIAYRSATLALVTCEASRTLVEVDLQKRAVSRSLATDQQIAHMLVLSPDGKRAFVANIGSGSISVFDLEAGALLSSVPTGKGAEGIAITPDGKEVWVSNREQDTLSVVTADTLEVRAVIACESFPIRVQFTPDGRRALVSNAKSGDVAIFEVATRKEVARLSLAVTPVERQDDRLFGAAFDGSPVPVGILIDPSGRRAFVANTNADVISVLDLEKVALSGRLRAGREPDGLGWAVR